MWPEGFLRVIEGAAAITIGARDAQMRPTMARGSAVVPGMAPRELTVYVVPDQAQMVLPCLRANGQVALLVVETMTLESYQLKGRVLDIADAPAEAEALLQAKHVIYRDEGARMGLPLSLIERVVLWPALAIRVAVDHLFLQTPGPGSGDRMSI